MKIYVINLERSADRREVISKQLQDANVSFEIFNAVDGSKDFDDQWRYNDKKRRFLRIRPLSTGEIACFASHYQLWKKCVELNEPIVVIEDDALPLPNISQSLNTATKLMEKYGCLRLFGHRGGKHRTIETLQDNYRIDFSRKGTLGSVAYALTPEAAQRFIAHGEEWLFGPDVYMNLSYKHGVGCFLLKPYCFSHAGEETTISDKKKHKKKLLNKAIKELHVGYIRIHSFLFDLSVKRRFK